MSSIDWEFVTHNILLSFLIVLLLLIFCSIIVSIIYFISLDNRLRNIRNRVFAKERRRLARYQRRIKRKDSKYPQIAAHVDVEDQRPISPIRKPEVKLNVSGVPRGDSRETIGFDVNEAKIESIAPTPVGSSGENKESEEN